MKLSPHEHVDRPWRIHAIAPDFRLEDVWSFRTPGAGPDDFPAMLQALRSRGGPRHQSVPVRLLFALRWRLGRLFGWEDPAQGIGHRVESLQGRLPEDLRQQVTGSRVDHTPFFTLYELSDESAYELGNRTVHDILHLGWVQGADGDYELRMAALVKPNGVFGRVYMAAIAPFRYVIVYPALTRQWERAWRTHRAAARAGSGRNGGDPA